jgi:hypothetical protein
LKTRLNDLNPASVSPSNSFIPTTDKPFNENERFGKF